MIVLPDYSTISPVYSYPKTLSAQRYSLKMAWNEQTPAWFLTITDSLGGEISGVKVVPNIPLLSPYRSQLTLVGDIVCTPISGTGDPTYDAFQGAFQLQYLDAQELEAYNIARFTQ